MSTKFGRFIGTDQNPYPAYQIKLCYYYYYYEPDHILIAEGLFTTQ